MYEKAQNMEEEVAVMAEERKVRVLEILRVESSCFIRTYNES